MADKTELILQKLDSHENMITQLVNMVAELKLSNDGIKTDIADIKKVQVQHGEMLSQLVQSQKKQDHILEILTLKAMDQEAEIKDIKEAI